MRGDFIVFFNQIFDVLCKLSADSDPNVQSAAHLLDRLVKVCGFFFWSLHACINLCIIDIDTNFFSIANFGWL